MPSMLVVAAVAVLMLHVAVELDSIFASGKHKKEDLIVHGTFLPLNM